MRKRETSGDGVSTGHSKRWRRSIRLTVDAERPAIQQIQEAVQAEVPISEGSADRPVVRALERKAPTRCAAWRAACQAKWRMRGGGIREDDEDDEEELTLRYRHDGNRRRERPEVRSEVRAALRSPSESSSIVHTSRPSVFPLPTTFLGRRQRKGRTADVPPDPKIGKRALHTEKRHAPPTALRLRQRRPRVAPADGCMLRCDLWFLGEFVVHLSSSLAQIMAIARSGSLATRPHPPRG